jgi:hypothetical protein
MSAISLSRHLAIGGDHAGYGSHDKVTLTLAASNQSAIISSRDAVLLGLGTVFPVRVIGPADSCSNPRLIDESPGCTDSPIAKNVPGPEMGNVKFALFNAERSIS